MEPSMGWKSGGRGSGLRRRLPYAGPWYDAGVIGRGLILVASAVLLLMCLGGCCSAVEPAPNVVRDWATRDLLLGSSEMDVKWFCFTHQLDYGAAGVHRGFGIGRPCNREQTPAAVLIDFNYDDDRRLTSWHVRGTETPPRVSP